MGKVLRALAVLAAVLACCALPVQAEEAVWGDAEVEGTGFSNPGSLCDGSRTAVASADGPAQVTITRADGIAGLYVEFDRLPRPWTLTDPAAGRTLSCGEQGFLHEYVDVSALGDPLPRQLVLDFPEGADVGELYVFSQGELPDWVQIWQPPCEEADLLLVSSHADDEQLFFAGVLPYYAVERGLSVQVAYVVQYFEGGYADQRRPHEQLDGLWTVGVRHYPVMGQFPDLYSSSTDRETALNQTLAVYGAEGYDYEDFVDYLTWCIRRFRPLVVVSHDLDGEYGHGTHVLCAAALGAALDRAADPAQELSGGAALEPWQVEKTYLHLYPEGEIRMDWDTPLDSLGGKTPFEVTQEGFACHQSQHWTWFYRWIYGTAQSPIRRAADITSYSPCRYGLYDTQVGPDVAGGDFFEHVETYAQRAQAEAMRLEEEQRLEQERAEAQRKAQQQALAEEQRRAQQQALAQQEAERHLRMGIAAMALAAAAGAAALAALIRRRRR